MIELRKISRDGLKEKLARHTDWCFDEPGGVQADLSHTILSDVDLHGANLSSADLRGAV